MTSYLAMPTTGCVRQLARKRALYLTNQSLKNYIFSNCTQEYITIQPIQYLHSYCLIQCTGIITANTILAKHAPHTVQLFDSIISTGTIAAYIVLATSTTAHSVTVLLIVLRTLYSRVSE